MMKCPKCQFENPDGIKFCGECGAKLEKSCPICGSINPPNFKFCGECGHDLRTTKETPPIDLNQPHSYTPKHLADKILTIRSSIEGERKLVTVLFADVANYTAMSEKLDPEEVHQIMDGCFKILMDEIHKYEGTINQFTGDGVMALFGAPVAHEDHAQRACYSSLSIQKAMKEYGERIKKDTGVDFAMRIGLNSGPVIVGTIGDDLRMDYTAVGDTTNLASRMESATNPGTILASANTHRLARDFFEFESRGEIDLKGKKDPQQAYELTKAGDVTSRIGASVAKGLTRFVGRKNSMGSLMQAFDKAKSGSGQVAAIVGEAGVGKSRLLLEMRNRLSQDETIYLEGCCIHFGGSMAYLPILDILRDYFEIQEDDREFIIKKKLKDTLTTLDRSFSSLIAPLQELLSLTVDDQTFARLEPKAKREKTFEALRDLIITISRNKPLVLVVEDLHWIDKTSEEFLDYLIGWLANSSIMLVLLYRPEYTHQWASKTYYTQIGLDQLGPQSSSQLIQALLEDDPIARDLQQLILDRAAGNPLFMEEFTHSLLENGTITKADQGYTLKANPSEIQVPDTIQGIISARIDRLEDNIKRTMQVASVIGRDFAFGILQSITGMRAELKSYLLNLQGLEFIYEKRLFPELEYIFKHALIQEVAYNSLLVKRRSEIHEKIGNAIEQIYAERLEEFYEVLAYHYTKAENLEKTCLYSRRSGDKATANYANQDAFRFYKAALDVLDKIPQTEEIKREQIDIRLAVWSPINMLGFPEGSIQIIKKGLRLAEEIGDEKKEAVFCSQLSNYYLTKGKSLQGAAFAEKCYRKAQKYENVELMAPSLIATQITNVITGDYLKIVEMTPAVLQLLEKTHNESAFFGRPVILYPEAKSYYAASLAMIGNFDEAETIVANSLLLATDMNHLLTLGIVEWMYATIFEVKGDGENIQKHAKNALEYLTKAGALYLLPIATKVSGMGHYYLEEFEAAKRQTQTAIQMYKDIGNLFLISYVKLGMSMIHLALREYKSALSGAEEALRLSQTNGERWIEGTSWVWLGRILTKNQSRKFSMAEENIIKGIDILEELKIKPYYAQGYLFLGELHAAKGDTYKATDILKKAEKMFQEMGMHYWLAISQKVLSGLEK